MRNDFDSIGEKQSQFRSFQDVKKRTFFHKQKEIVLSDRLKQIIRMVIIIIGTCTTISFTPIKNIVQVFLSLLASVLPSLLSIALLLLLLGPSSLICILVLIIIIVVVVVIVVPMGLLPHQRHFNNRRRLR